MTIWFDMDGTIADLYGVNGWLDYLLACDATPYKVAKPLVNMNVLARKLNNLRKLGYKVGIISWLAKNSNADYDNAVTLAKLAWLAEHLASVTFDEIRIVSYGVNKWQACGEGILFDDEAKNRDDWKGEAFEPCHIMEVLKNL